MVDFLSTAVTPLSKHLMVVLLYFNIMIESVDSNSGLSFSERCSLACKSLLEHLHLDQSPAFLTSEDFIRSNEIL